jgi:branched-chain amino acid transport system substrate-binding protein
MRGRIAAVLLVLTMLAAACGTRLDDGAFEVSFDEAGGQSGGTSDATVSGLTFEGGGGDDTAFDAGEGFAAEPGQAEAGPDDAGVPDAGGAVGAQGAAGTAAQGDPADGQPDGPGGGDPASAGAPAEGSQGGGGGQNTASDTGVTPTSIKVGNIVSRGGSMGPNQFTPSYFGANAYFQLVNARGGVNGRQIEYVTCDDREEPGDNIRCVQQMIESEEVFAFVANNTRAYAGARQVSEAQVPDVAGLPIGNEYDTYPYLYSMYGTYYERDGRVGDNGTLYWPTAHGHWFSQQGITKAAVFYYSVAISKQAGQMTAAGLEASGIEVVEYEVNPALPNWDSFVSDMRSRGVEAIWDTVDVNANQNLCRAMERRGMEIQAKVSTIAAWSQTVGETFPTVCRDAMYVTGSSVPLATTSEPGVAEFRETMQRVYGGQFEGRLHQWAFEGWLGAKMFVEAVESMGGEVTREGLVRWLDAQKDYTHHGLGSVRDWQPINFSNPPPRWCILIGKWDENVRDFTMVAPPDTCVPNSWLPYEPVA